MITETDDIRQAIDDAAQRWPEIAADRPALVRRLILNGARSGAEEAARARMRQLEALAEISGKFTGMYPPNAARELVQEWPE